MVLNCLGAWLMTKISSLIVLFLVFAVKQVSSPASVVFPHHCHAQHVVHSQKQHIQNPSDFYQTGRHRVPKTSELSDSKCLPEIDCNLKAHPSSVKTSKPVLDIYK